MYACMHGWVGELVVWVLERVLSGTGERDRAHIRNDTDEEDVQKTRQ